MYVDDVHAVDRRSVCLSSREMSHWRRTAWISSLAAGEAGDAAAEVEALVVGHELIARDRVRRVLRHVAGTATARS